MDRKKAIIAAATVAGSLLAASSAYALTSGVIGTNADDGAGDLSPVLDVNAVDETTTVPTTSPGDESTTTPDDDAVDQTSDDAPDDAVDHEAEADDTEHEAEEPHELEGREDDD